MRSRRQGDERRGTRSTERRQTDGRGGDDRFALNFGGKGATIAFGEQLEPLISPLEASDRRSPFVSRLNDDAKEELTEAEPRNEDENVDEPETGSTEVSDQEDSKRTEDEIEDWIIQDERQESVRTCTIETDGDGKCENRPNDAFMTKWETRMTPTEPANKEPQLTPELTVRTVTPRIEELVIKEETTRKQISPIIEELKVEPEKRLVTLKPVVEGLQLTPECSLSLSLFEWEDVCKWPKINL